MTMLRMFILMIFLVTCLAFGSTTPLIKNIQRGGMSFEEPHWSATENVLYWVDVDDQKVYKLDWETNTITTRAIGYGRVSLLISVKDNPDLILLSVRSGLYFLNWYAPECHSSLRLLSVVDLGLPDNRINDGKVDCKGRLWFGTMGKQVKENVDPDKGSLYMMDKSNYVHPEIMVRPVSVSNGMAFTSDSKFMFYIDTPTRNIDVFDFDLTKGSIRNRRTFFSFESNNVTGYPDGMTIDSDDNLWVACFNGWKVIKIDYRAGKLLEEYWLPVQKVTSVMWGGHDLSTLFVTTCSVGLSQAELNTQPEAGSLFAIEGTGAKGRPENQFVFPDAAKY